MMYESKNGREDPLHLRTHPTLLVEDLDDGFTLNRPITYYNEADRGCPHEID